ncbi:uncharacterized protein LOC142584399 [Dermacentor variabilis]|uniref:uncharacterized protein LOC142584399 n=1 Tax=Dermacentor variabilis TaxID=34621 RepID=UPI003F5AEE77
MIGISALFLLSLASSVLCGDYHTTVTEAAAPVGVSHAGTTAAGATDHAALTSEHSDVHADVHAVTTGSATVGSVPAVPAVGAFHGDSTTTAVHGYPGVTSIHDSAAAHAIYAAPVVNAVHTSISGVPGAVSSVHEPSAAVTNVHAAPAVATPAIGTLHTPVEGASAVGTVPASPTSTTTVPGAPAVTTVHSSPAGVSKDDTTSTYPAPTVTAYQDGSAYPAYYNPQFAYGPYYQPFPFANGGAAPDSKMTYQVPYGQSAYQPAPVDSGYYQPSPYFGYVPGFGRPSAYPTAPVFPAYPATQGANAYQAGSAMTPVQNTPSVTNVTTVGSYPSSPIASTVFHDAAASVAGGHAMPAVATPSTTYQTYQTGPGVATVHSTPGIATVHSTPTMGTASATYQATPEVGSVHTGPAAATTYQAADHAVSNVHQTPAVNPFPAFAFYQHSPFTAPAASQMTKVDSYQTSPAVGAVHSSAPGVTSVHEAAPGAVTLHSAGPAVGVHESTPSFATFHSATPGVTTVHETGSAGPSLHAASPAVATTDSAVHEAGPALTSVHGAPVASSSPAGVTSVGTHHVLPALTAVHGADTGVTVPTAVHAAPAAATTYGADPTVTGVQGYPFAAGYGLGPAFDFVPAYGYGVQDLGYGVAPFGAELSHAFPHYGLNYAYGLGPINYNALYLRRKKK